MRKYKLIPVLFMIFYLSGCFETVDNHRYFSERLTESYMSSRWLPALEAGITTREQLVEKLGEPSGIFENGRIYTYRLIINEWKDGLSDKMFDNLQEFYLQADILKKTAIERFEKVDSEGFLLVVSDENEEKYEKEIISSLGEFHLVIIFTADGILNRYSLIRIRP